jgi:glycosyltransferase involved in cell wall biosynthesis
VSTPSSTASWAAAAGRNDLELHVHGRLNRWSGDYLEDLKRRARGSVGNVTFHGRFDNRRIGGVLQNIDVLVLPSIWFENAPLTLNEAAMSGTRFSSPTEEACSSS